MPMRDERPPARTKTNQDKGADPLESWRLAKEESKEVDREKVDISRQKEEPCCPQYTRQRPVFKPTPMTHTSPSLALWITVWITGLKLTEMG